MRSVVHSRAQRARRQFCLDEDELPGPHFFLEQRVNGFLQFPLLVGGDGGLAGGLAQLLRTAVACDKPRPLQRAAVEQREPKPLHPRTEFCHEVARERSAAGPVGAQVTDEGIKPHRGERRDPAVAQQRVEKREERVDRIARRAAAPSFEGKRFTRRRTEVA